MRHSYAQFVDTLCGDDNGKLIDSFIAVEVGRDHAEAWWEAHCDMMEADGEGLDFEDTATQFVLGLMDECDITQIDFEKLTQTT